MAVAADALITKGLELFASGDLLGAARTWLTAKKEAGHSPQLDVYLEHIKAVTGEAYTAIEAELGTSSVLTLATPAGAPTPPSPAAVHTPTLAPLTAPPPPTLRITPPPAPRVTPAPVMLELEYNGAPEPIFDTPELAKSEPQVPPPTVVMVQRAVASLPVVMPPPPVAVAAGPWGGDSMLGPPMEVRGPGGGLDLVAAKGKSVEPIAVPRGELAREEAKLKERLRLDDFTGALELAERLLKSNAVHPLALSARERCRSNLQQIYSSKLGTLERAPKVLIPPEQVIWLDLDHRTGFVLAQVDGISSYEDLIELSGMDRLEALRLMAQLLQKGVIGPG
jgi:hypothetical protein